MSIHFHTDSLELSLPVVTALLSFAGRDVTRGHLGVGIDNGAVCATDGHVLLRFECSEQAKAAGQGLVESLHGKVWSRSHVETAFKVAKAQKAPFVRLAYADMLTDRFPPVCQVIPDYGLEASRPIGFNPAYVGLLSAVAKACACAGAILVAARGELDPLGFRVSGPDLSATAVVMPMRV